MKKITAKFNSVCAETGVRIRKGEQMMYDYSTRKCYAMNSTQAKGNNSNDFVQDPGEIYFDNFCMNNGI